MKHKGTLVLMEQLLMVLIFSLAAAACLGIFVQSSRISRQTALRDEAAVLVQNAAELLKQGEDPHTLDTGDLSLAVTAVPSPVAGLAMAHLEASYAGEVLFSLNTGWQEVLP